MKFMRLSIISLSFAMSDYKALYLEEKAKVERLEASLKAMEKAMEMMDRCGALLEDEVKRLKQQVAQQEGRLRSPYEFPVVRR